MTNHTLQALKEMTAEVEYLKEQNNTLKTRVITCNNQTKLWKGNCKEWKDKHDTTRQRLMECEALLEKCEFRSKETMLAKNIYFECSKLDEGEVR